MALRTETGRLSQGATGPESRTKSVRRARRIRRKRRWRRSERFSLWVTGSKGMKPARDPGPTKWWTPRRPRGARQAGRAPTRCSGETLPRTTPHDRDAVTYQRWHRRFIRGAAILGALAVISASVHSIPGFASDASLSLELAGRGTRPVRRVGLAAGWKRSGSSAGSGERYRLLKFELLTEPPAGDAGRRWTERGPREAGPGDRSARRGAPRRGGREGSPTYPHRALARAVDRSPSPA